MNFQSIVNAWLQYVYLFSYLIAEYIHLVVQQIRQEQVPVVLETCLDHLHE